MTKRIKIIGVGIVCMMMLAINVQAATENNEEGLVIENAEESAEDEIQMLEEEQPEQQEQSDEPVFLDEQADEKEVSEVSDLPEIQNPTLQYRAHVSNIGWMDFVDVGMMGTTGKNLPMEALEISVKNCEALGIEYQVHVSNVGWMDSVSDGEMAGTTGRALAMEAVKMTLTGDLADSYDLYYRAHVTNLGWLDWAKNGEAAGSQGYAYTLQAIEVLLLPAGSEAPENDGEKDAFYHKIQLYHEAYVQNRGWTSKNNISVIAGTTGKNLNMDALKLSTNGAYGVGIAYSAHVRNIGWMDYVSDGEVAGVLKNGHTIEAVKIYLTGENADRYDLYYRAHVANIGWLDWAKNDEVAGSFGLGYAMQAVEIRVVEKGGNAPGNTVCTYVEKPNVSYWARVSDEGWQDLVTNGAVAGTTGKNLPMRAFAIELPEMDNLNIKYRAHVSNIGWQDYVSGGDIAGTENTSNNIEAVQIELTGASARYYDVWYRVHSANLGWLGWAKNGEKAGTASLCYDAQAIQIVIKLKGSAAPGNTDKAFVDTLEEDYLWPLPGNYYITSYFGYRNQPTAGASSFHQGIDIDGETGDIIVATKSGVVTAATYNSIRGYYVEITHDDGVKTIYMHMNRYAVSEGMRVSRGQTIGYVGSTGVSTGSHLHFSVLINGTNVNPLDYVSRG